LVVLWGPVIVGIVLFGSASAKIPAKDVQISSVNNLYYYWRLVPGCSLVLLGISKLPSVTSDEKIEPSSQSQYVPLGIIFVTKQRSCLFWSCNPADFVFYVAHAKPVSKSYFVYASLAIILITLLATTSTAAGKA
jgi:FHS family L-fucose permease-like MFS transporter